MLQMCAVLRRKDVNGLRPIDSWTLMIFVCIRFIIGGPHGEQPISLEFS